MTTCVEASKTIPSTTAKQKKGASNILPNRLFAPAATKVARRETSCRPARNASSDGYCAKQKYIPTGKLRQRYFMPYLLTVLRHCSKVAILAIISHIRRGPYHHRQHCVGIEKQAGFRPSLSHVTYIAHRLLSHPLLLVSPPLPSHPLIITPSAVWPRFTDAP